MSQKPLIIDQKNTGSSSTQLSSNSSVEAAFLVENKFPSRIALYGLSSAMGNSNGVGVIGQTDGYNGIGVSGTVYTSPSPKAPGKPGVGIGVYGESDVADVGIGVRGSATADSGEVYGVHGTCHSYEGAGVLAENWCTKESGGDALLCRGHAMPIADDRYNLGNARRRWKLIRGVTITPGDLVFENGVRTTEENDGLAFFNPNGTKIALLDAEGNFHIKGKIIKDL